jgi:hypothetical protein
MKQGETHVGDGDLIRELRALDVDDPHALDRLVERIRAESLKAPKEAVSLWLTGDESDSERASDMISELEELVLTPLLHVCGESEPIQQIHIMAMAVDIQLALREKMVVRLDRLLDDRTPLPEPELPESIEEEPFQVRVCDEAYLLMRKLLKFSENEVNYELNSDEFMDLSEEEKDAEIRKARTSETWTSWVEEMEY